MLTQTSFFMPFPGNFHHRFRRTICFSHFHARNLFVSCHLKTVLFTLLGSNIGRTYGLLGQLGKYWNKACFMNLVQKLGLFRWYLFTPDIFITNSNILLFLVNTQSYRHQLQLDMLSRTPKKSPLSILFKMMFQDFRQDHTIPGCNTPKWMLVQRVKEKYA